MAFLNKETFNVDAVLTKEGKKRLIEKGWLDIGYFKVSDIEIDYNLYDTGSVSGSKYYGQQIEFMPIRQPNRILDPINTIMIPDPDNPDEEIESGRIDLLYPNTCSYSALNSWGL